MMLIHFDTRMRQIQYQHLNVYQEIIASLLLEFKPQSCFKINSSVVQQSLESKRHLFMTSLEINEIMNEFFFLFSFCALKLLMQRKHI